LRIQEVFGKVENVFRKRGLGIVIDQRRPTVNGRYDVFEIVGEEPMYSFAQRFFHFLDG
jgi:hypothetical protein